MANYALEHTDSTFIRNEVKNGHLNSVSSQLPKRVYNEIKYGKYYR